MKLWRKKKRRSYAATPKHVLIKQVLIGVALFSVFALMGAAVWYTTRIEALTIESVEVSGGETVAHEEIEALVERELNGSYFKLVPKRFAWVYPEESIEDAIESEERVKDVSVVRTSGTELSIRFTEYHPAALWCTGVDTDECLFLDESGYAFGAAPQLSGNTFISFSDTRKEPEVETNAFEKEEYVSFLEFIRIIKERFGLVIYHVERIGEDDFTYHISGGGALKISNRLPLEETLQNLETILTSTEFDHIAAGNFQYIDLRYGDKVFVNETLESDVAVTATSTDEVIEEEVAITTVEEVEVEEENENSDASEDAAE